MYSLLRPFLFLLPPEAAHKVTLVLLKIILKIPFGKSLIGLFFGYENPKLAKNVVGLNFKNPVGLSAGFDKNATYIDAFSHLGFGFIEIGTVTPKPQSGNPQPRLFRLPMDGALINRMGFNNDGVDKILARLKQRKSTIIVGANLGKNKTTTKQDAINDYLICFDKLFDHVDYFAVNVSSPNTPGLRELQAKESLKKLLSALKKANQSRPSLKPLLLKIAPDLSASQLDDILSLAHQGLLDGLILSNTTVRRSDLQTPARTVRKIGEGGLSGSPLFGVSNEVLKYIRKQDKQIPIIATGGIMSEKDALKKIALGANLVQVYTGLVYRGPALVKQIKRTLVKQG